jgi:peptide/nickel transport system substrate-binding protein
VDRKSIVEKIFFGVHKVGVGPLSEGVWARSDDAEKRFGYDSKKAEQILDEAGWKSASGVGGIREKGGQKLGAVLATFRSPWTEMAEAMQAQLRAIGMDLQVQKMERGPYLDFTRESKQPECQRFHEHRPGWHPARVVSLYPTRALELLGCCRRTARWAA